MDYLKHKRLAIIIMGATVMLMWFAVFMSHQLDTETKVVTVTDRFMEVPATGLNYMRHNSYVVVDTTSTKQYLVVMGTGIIALSEPEEIPLP